MPHLSELVPLSPFDPERADTYYHRRERTSRRTPYVESDRTNLVDLATGFEDVSNFDEELLLGEGLL